MIASAVGGYFGVQEKGKRKRKTNMIRVTVQNGLITEQMEVVAAVAILAVANYYFNLNLNILLYS